MRTTMARYDRGRSYILWDIGFPVVLACAFFGTSIYAVAARPNFSSWFAFISACLMTIGTVIFVLRVHGGRNLTNRSFVVAHDDISYVALRKAWLVELCDINQLSAELEGKHLKSASGYQHDRFVVIKGVLDRYFIFTKEVDLAYRGSRDQFPNEMTTLAKQTFRHVLDVCKELDEYHMQQKQHAEEDASMRHSQQETALDNARMMALKRFRSADTFEQQATRG